MSPESCEPPWIFCDRQKVNIRESREFALKRGRNLTNGLRGSHFYMCFCIFSLSLWPASHFFSFTQILSQCAPKVAFSFSFPEVLSNRSSFLSQEDAVRWRWLSGRDVCFSEWPQRRSELFESVFHSPSAFINICFMWVF